MREVLLNLTTSLDGFIADAGGGIDWILPEDDDGVPDDYLELMRSVDTLVMGRATYELSLRIPHGMDVFAGKSAFVFTSRHDLTAFEGVGFVREDPVPFVEKLRRADGGTIWLYGGGRLATALEAAGLIDDYLIVIQPVLLGDGIRLWQGGHGRRALRLSYTREWPGGLAEVRYRPGA